MKVNKKKYGALKPKLTSIPRYISLNSQVHKEQGKTKKLLLKLTKEIRPWNRKKGISVKTDEI